MKKHKIEWTDFTWNPVWGCKGGCGYCYARSIAKRFAELRATDEAMHYLDNYAMGPYFNKFGRGFLGALKIQEQLKKFEPTFLTKQFDKEFPKNAKKIFMGSMTDIAFWDEDWQIDVIKKIEDHPQYIFQILTKFPDKIKHIDFPENVWLGLTAETQQKLRKRIYDFIKIKAGLHFLSLEPMQDSIDLKEVANIRGSNYLKALSFTHHLHEEFINSPIKWVIVGGQNGNNSLPLNPDWVRDIKNICEEINIPFFFKGWGNWLPWEYDIQPPFINSQNKQDLIDSHGVEMYNVETSEINKNWYDIMQNPDLLSNNRIYGFENVGGKKSGKTLDGKIYEEFPEL